MLFKIVRIRGDSLSPLYRDGDYVIASGQRSRLSRLRPGDVILFRQPGYGQLIKRIERIEPCGSLFVLGSAPDSTDSRVFGPVPRSAVSGVVVAHFRGQARL